eukprot:TRINITY_DN7730_c3_g1_i1.p1 TRINITY_DN7730_c3_g1~~TRINITY_DN7730_c3_g1_i1.p1  ORF type:complete len:189 (+),score=71.31 TRINITY_DN7730_c3_g1_i1:65-631(+)
MRCALLLLCLAAAARADEEGAAAESWLDLDSMARVLSDLGYPTSKGKDALLLPLKGDKEEKASKSCYVQLGDSTERNSVSITASWGSRQPAPRLSGPSGDSPIVNQWNAQRRFAKLSVQPDPDNAQGSQLVMHMDQLLNAGGLESDEYERVKGVMSRAVDVFHRSVTEFDEYLQKSYKDWAEKLHGMQ